MISSALAGGRRTFIRVTPEIAVVLQAVRILGGATQGHRQRVGITAGLLRHLPETRQEILRLAGAGAIGLRDDAVAVADRAPRRIAEGAADDNRRMRLLQRLGPSHHRREVDDIAVVFRLILGPDRLHRLDLLAQFLKTGLVDVPWSSISSAFQLPPMPKMKRPPETWSSEETSFAVWIVSR